MLSSPDAASSSRAVAFLTRLFGDPADFEGCVRSVCVLVCTPFASLAANPPTVYALRDLLDPHLGSLLVRIADLCKLPLPALTRSSHAGWGAARCSTHVLPALTNQVRLVFKAFAASSAARVFTTPVQPIGAGGGGGALSPSPFGGTGGWGWWPAHTRLAKSLNDRIRNGHSPAGGGIAARQPATSLAFDQGELPP